MNSTDTQELSAARGANTALRAANRALRGDNASLRASNVELERSNQDLAVFAHVAAHDMSEPLRMISSFLELLERRYGEQLDETAHRYIWFARDGAHRMRQLIDALLSYAEVGTVALDRRPVDTTGLVRSVLEDLRVPLDEAGATVSVDSLPVVDGDRRLLALMFQNLLANAAKFRGSQPCRISISADRAGDMWAFAVTDNGIGIPAEQAERVFDMFTRLHPRTDYAGAGIGLAMCRKIVERHGGAVTAQPAPGEVGARIVVWLPATAGEETPS